MCDHINAIIALNKNGGSKPPPYGILTCFAPQSDSVGFHLRHADFIHQRWISSSLSRISFSSLSPGERWHAKRDGVSRRAQG